MVQRRKSLELPVELLAVVVAVTGDRPRVLTIADGMALPAGPFESDQRSLQAGVRAWVERQTHHPLGYVEQLYTFADRDRGTGEATAPLIAISYLGLTREPAKAGGSRAGWDDWYRYFPWEDQRGEAGAGALVGIQRALKAWVAGTPDVAVRRARAQHAAITFGLRGRPWNEELVLQRYELLYEAGLVEESLRQSPGRTSRTVAGTALPPLGRAMSADHRRILATAMARLRAKIKYRPVVFELMPERFTLLQLQRAVEGLAGRAVHKQNFRRLVEQQALVEATGAMTAGTHGRPARLFRFRRAVLAERAVIGTKLPLVRT